VSRQLSAALGQEGGLAPALPDQRDSQVDYFFTVEGLSSLRVSSQLRAAQGQEGGSPRSLNLFLYPHPDLELVLLSVLL